MSVPIPFPGLSKNILLVGDEGISIFNAGSGGVRYIDQIAWLTPDFEAKLSDTLKRDCPKKPVVILYDMVEQHYRKEMVPKVGPFDRANVVKRKVAITFPNYKMRSALALKQGKGKEDEIKGLKSSPYLFAAVPSSELMSSLLRGVISSGLPINGLYLLPVEGVNLINKLSKKVGSKDKKSRWTLLMGQHSSGNLRQIVTKDGELALTRMTPFSEDQSNSGAWAQSIFQEYKVTISYLSRLGYKADDGIDIIMIAPEEAEQDLNNHFAGEGLHLHSLTTHEAAALVSLKIGIQEDAEYADILYVAWAGQTQSFTMPIPVDSFGRASRPRMIANVLLFAGAAAGLWFGYQAAVVSTELFSVKSDLKSREASLKGEQEKYALLLDEKEKEGYDIRLYKGAFAAEKELDKYALKPFTVLKGVALALGPVLSIDDITIRHANGTELKFESLDAVPKNLEESYIQSDNTSNNGYPLYTRLSMTFAASVSQEEAQKILNDLIKRMQHELPQYEISLAKAVRDRAYEMDVEGRIGAQSEQPELQEDNTAVIEIKGAV